MDIMRCHKIARCNMKEFIEKLIERLEEYHCENEFETNSGFIEVCIDIVNGLAEEYKPKTNADRIRSMTDEGLAEFLCELDTIGTEPKSLWNGEFWIDEGEELLNWLQSEVEGE